MHQTWTCVDSPIGTLRLMMRDGRLTGLHVADHEKCPPMGDGWEEDPAAFTDVRRQLDEYFEGRRTTFDVKFELDGSAFQRQVWQALTGIPYGETISYGELARRVGRTGAARAVGAANGRNPVSIIVPCHRVIGADGTLTGYGWGNDRKAWLLRLEGAVA